MAARVSPPDRTLRSARELVSAGLADAAEEFELTRVGTRYTIALTPQITRLIEPGRPDDPIARQFVPDTAELIAHPDELTDPIGDHSRSPLPGLVHRYPDRVLLKIVGICPVYCRFCFRREMVGPEAGRTLSQPEIEAALAYIHRHPEIWEVILTGGDPFMLSPRRARDLMSGLAAISHVRVIRWHTRVPVAEPARVTPEFIAAMKTYGSASVIVGVHVNHPRELHPDARAALARLADAGIALVSQSVLLKGVNDDADTLEALMRGLVEARVLPYYLHHPDLAPGTAHFRVPIARGLALMAELGRRVSGIARPDYVLDLPGAHGKVSLLSTAVVRRADGRYDITDRDGAVHRYTDALREP